MNAALHHRATPTPEQSELMISTLPFESYSYIAKWDASQSCVLRASVDDWSSTKIGELSLMSDEANAAKFTDIVREAAVRARHEHEVLGHVELAREVVHHRWGELSTDGQLEAKISEKNGPVRTVVTSHKVNTDLRIHLVQNGHCKSISD